MKSGRWTTGDGRWRLIGAGVTAGILALLYLSTMARTLVLGDPTEYTMASAVWGIPHPPGYAFITLMGKLFQTLIPFGDLPWRMHLLSVVAGILGALAIYFLLTELIACHPLSVTRYLPAVITTLLIGTSANYWQHAIHANPHIITAAFLALNLALLTHWYTNLDTENAKKPQSTQRFFFSFSSVPSASPLIPLCPNRSLYLFAFCVGLGITHHPLTAFGLPAYALFILLAYPRILGDWRTMGKMAICGLLGLTPWLYFPIRSPMQPVFGPHDMNALNGFLNVVLAQGLRVNLFHFGLADQPDRALVFWTLSRLQYSLLVILLAVWGIWQLLRADWRLLLLYGGAFAGITLFVINSVQDVMAYLLGPFLIVGLLAGIGLSHLLKSPTIQGKPIVAALFLLLPAYQISQNLPHISLKNYSEGADHLTAIETQFAGTNRNAILLHDWERMTPVWYADYVENSLPPSADVTPVYVGSGTANPWVDTVYRYLPSGALYLTDYTPEIISAGFRLRPEGAFYQVVEVDESLPEGLIALPMAGDAGNPEKAEIIGYQLPQTIAQAGDYLPLTLAMRTANATTDFYAPVLHIGDIRYPFTTDNHLISPLWQPNEVIVERFDFALPLQMPAGDYPITVQLHNLSQDMPIGEAHSLGVLRVSAHPNPPATDHLLANFRQQVGLRRATARMGLLDRHNALWEPPIVAKAGETIHLTLEWEALARPTDDYRVFVHLMNAGNPVSDPILALDYNPLGGAAPTYLWIPKWLPGQRLLDPYRLQLPAGDYFIEVGLYEMSRGNIAGRRLHIQDNAGNLVGDRIVLGGISVR